MMQMTYETYYDKVRGGWVGKCAGGILGAPLEGFKRFNDVAISDKLFETNFANDDLDLQVLWLDLVQQKGPMIRHKDLAQHWLAHVGFPWNEYGIATRNIRNGVLPPESGRLNNAYWKHSMGCPIRSEIWGMLCPGMPREAAFYAGMDASIDHDGFSVHAEQYLSACAALAFYATDIPTVLSEGLQYIPADSDMYRMVQQVRTWHQQYPLEVSMGKIKSYYGDADFTAAPMNIAFTILALLRSEGSFSGIAEALRMGHDSDCVVATAGALIGIMQGYEAIPGLWKQRVGNEVLISDAIIDIHKPATIEELATLTCNAGQQFIHHYSGKSRAAASQPYFLHFKYPQWSDALLNTDLCLEVVYENPGHVAQEVVLVFKSRQIRFGAELMNMRVGGGERKTEAMRVLLDTPEDLQTAIEGRVEVWVDGVHVGREQLIFPYYGSWLLLGPFIEDDPGLEPCSVQFPDHGMSSLPSVQYMNHDRIATGKEFLSQPAIARLVADNTWADQPFHAAVIHCASFQIPFAQYVGKGERTVYLYSELSLAAPQQLWISMGCSAAFSLHINGECVYSAEAKRTWPGAHTLLHNFAAGNNAICIRVDCAVDTVKMEFGLKEFAGQHPHQSHWSMHIPFFQPVAGKRSTTPHLVLATD